MLWFNKKDENYEEEIWKKVENYEDYEVSNLGHCRRLNQDGTYSSIGYIDVSQSRIKVELKNEEGERRQTTLGHLVAETFLPNPDNCKWVKNIDGDFMNNRVDNLQWVVRNNKTKTEVEYNDKDRIDNELKKANKTTNTEIWKWVVDYERWYEVSNYGNVRKINDDGSKKLLNAKEDLSNKRGRVVGLRKMSSVKNFMISHLVADAFNLQKTKENGKAIYHIDGNVNNDCLTNLTYNYKETEKYIKEQEKLKAQETKTELKEYVEANKDFLKQAKEINKEVTLKDIYDKLNELIEVIKNDNR